MRERWYGIDGPSIDTGVIAMHHVVIGLIQERGGRPAEHGLDTIEENCSDMPI